MAAGVGLFARYRIVAEHYGLYAGLGFVAGFLIVTALVLLLAAHTEAQRLSNLRVFSKSSSGSLTLSPAQGARATGASPITASPSPSALAAEAKASSDDLFGPLALCLQSTSGFRSSDIRFWTSSSET
jgi:hypothetical protein